MTQTIEPTMEQRVSALEQSHQALRADLDTNTRMTAAVKADTATLVAFTDALKGFATLCRWIAKSVKWLAVYIAPIVLAGIAAWAFVTGRKAP